MSEPTTIDTTNLFSILGFAAAVWAVVPQSNKLKFRFCMTPLDWGIAIGVFCLAHYLTFAPVLQSMGLYYSFGPWLWGLDSSSAVYLLLLAAIIYFFWRSRSPMLSRNKINIFCELIENLLLSNSYDKLVLLLEPQLLKLISLSESSPCLASLAECISQRLRKKNDTHANITHSWFEWRSRLNRKLQVLKVWSLKNYRVNEAARDILLNIVTTPDMITYIAISRPYVGLKLLKADVVWRSEFIEQFMNTLLNSPRTRLYVELKNNLNNKIGRRLQLPESNRLLY